MQCAGTYRLARCRLLVGVTGTLTDRREVGNEAKIRAVDTMRPLGPTGDAFADMAAAVASNLNVPR